MNHLAQLAYEYRFAIGATSWYVVSAFIVTMPEKDKPYNFYGHMYDFAHQMLNIKPIAGLSAK